MASLAWFIISSSLTQVSSLRINSMESATAILWEFHMHQFVNLHTLSLCHDVGHRVLSNIVDHDMFTSKALICRPECLPRLQNLHLGGMIFHQYDDSDLQESGEDGQPTLPTYMYAPRPLGLHFTNTCGRWLRFRERTSNPIARIVFDNCSGLLATEIDPLKDDLLRTVITWDETEYNSTDDEDYVDSDRDLTTSESDSDESS
jgi:hypothetical protein